MKGLSYFAMLLFVACTQDNQQATDHTLSEALTANSCCSQSVEGTACDPSDPLFRFRYLTTQIGPPPRPGEGRSKVCVVPDRSIKYRNGVVLGLDAGEFGGQLAYRDAQGKTSVLLLANVKELISVEDVYIFTGNQHLSLNEGNIYRLEGKENGVPHMSLAAELDGEPQEILRSSNGVTFFTSRYEGREPNGNPIFAKSCYVFNFPSTLKKRACIRKAPPN